VTRRSAASVVSGWIRAINAADLPGFLRDLEDDCVLVEPQHTYLGKGNLTRWFEMVVVHRSSTLRLISAHDAEPDHLLAWAEWHAKSFHDEVTLWTPLAVLITSGRIREIHISPPMRVPVPVMSPSEPEESAA